MNSENEKSIQKQEENEYSKQLKLTLLNLLGETPNFVALLISALTTKAILVFVDLIDTAGNVMRNILVVFISKRLKKDLKFQYNYGVGKIEALSSMMCDFLMIVSLLIMVAFAIKDLIYPRSASEGAMLFVILVKTVNVLGDAYIYFKQRKICKASDSLVLKSSLSVAFKNLIFDSTSFTALILMAVFGDKRFIWYLSPIVSFVLGGYLIYITINRLIKTVSIMLDRSAEENVQISILQVMAEFYDRYESVKNVQSRLDGETVIIDLNLGFSKDTTYEQMQELVKEISEKLSEKLPKCDVSLRVNNQ